MNERLKEIRKLNRLTQEEFAKEIGITQSTVTAYECGNRVPSDSVILNICRNFNINETWLRTGEGEMLTPISRDAEIAAFLGDVMRGEKEDFRRRLVSVLARLEPAEWELLANMAQRLAEEYKKED